MAGSANIAGKQHYILGIGHPQNEALSEGSPAVISSDGREILGENGLNIGLGSFIRLSTTDGLANATYLQSALDSTSGKLTIADGTYPIDGNLTMYIGKHILYGVDVTLNFTASSGYAISAYPHTIDTYNHLTAIEGIRIKGPQSESSNLDGLFIGRPDSMGYGNTAHAEFKNVEITGFRDDLVIKNQTWCNVFTKCKIGKAWRRGVSYEPVVNGGENLSFYGSVIFDVKNTSQTGVGIYMPDNSNAGVYFYSTSFDYCDYLVDIRAGVANFFGCHFENNNGLPMFEVAYTPGKEPTKVVVVGGDMVSGPLGSTPEPAEGRPTFFAVNGSAAEVSVDGIRWNRYNKPASELVTVESGSPRVTISGVETAYLAGAIPSICSYTNQLYNGGFETGNADGWSLFNVTGSSMAIESSIKRTGAYSWKIVGTNSAGSPAITQKVAVKQGDRLLTRGYFKTTGLAAGNVEMQIRFYSSNDLLIQNVILNTITTDVDWTQIGDCKIVPKGAYYAVIYGFARNFIGTVYCDDIEAISF